MKTLLLFLYLAGSLCFIVPQSLHAQTQVRFYISTTQSQILTQDTALNFSSRRSHAYGIDVLRYVNRPIYLSLGLQYLTQGAQRTELADRNDPMSITQAHYISENINIPIMIGFSFIKSTGLSLSGELGFTTAIAAASIRQLDNSNFKTNNNLFTFISYNYRLSIPVRIKIKDRTALFIRPLYFKQLNTNAFDFKNKSIGIDLGLTIRVGKVDGYAQEYPVFSH